MGNAAKAFGVLEGLLAPPKPTPSAQKAIDAAAQRMVASQVKPPDGTIGLAVVPPPTPTVSLRDTASRWYDNTEGGFDKAVADSQSAMQQYPIPHYQLYGGWDAGAVDRQFPVSLAKGEDRSLGRFDPSTNSVEISPAQALNAPPSATNATLEHEATHGVTLAHHNDLLNQPPSSRQSMDDRIRWGESVVAVNDATHPFWAGSGHPVNLEDTLRRLINKKHSLGPDDARAHVDEHLRNYIQQHAEYLTEARELDPRIAEVRRHYAWNTGNSVRTPEDAEKAWQWFGENLEGIDEAESASMAPMAYRLYDGLPESVKRIMYARMTHIPAALGPVGAASMAAQQEQSAP